MPINMNELAGYPPVRMWASLGFLRSPTLVAAEGSEQLYRAWGGTSLERSESRDRKGQFLSLWKARTRYEAERYLSVMEYGNQLLWVTEFKVKARTPMWVGQVDPGDDFKSYGNIPGSQVLLEREFEPNLSKVKCNRLFNDMAGVFVVAQRGPKLTN